MKGWHGLTPSFFSSNSESIKERSKYFQVSSACIFYKGNVAWFFFPVLETLIWFPKQQMQSLTQNAHRPKAEMQQKIGSRKKSPLHSASAQGVSCNFYILKMSSYVIHTSATPAPKEAMLKFFWKNTLKGRFWRWKWKSCFDVTTESQQYINPWL